MTILVSESLTFIEFLRRPFKGRPRGFDPGTSESIALAVDFLKKYSRDMMGGRWFGLPSAEELWNVGELLAWA